MRQTLVCVASLCLAVFAVAAQEPSKSDARKFDLLSIDQQIKMAQLITKQTTLTSSAFSIQMDGIVPPQIEIHPLPPEAAQLAPQVRGFGYVVVEEQIALVDQRTRKIELVFPRWGK